MRVALIWVFLLSACVTPPKEVVVSVAADGAIMLDGRSVALQDLEKQPTIKTAPYLCIVADDRVLYVRLVEILEALRKAGARRFENAAPGTNRCAGK